MNRSIVLNLKFAVLNACLIWNCSACKSASKDKGALSVTNSLYSWLPDNLDSVPRILRPGELSTSIDKFNFSLSPLGDTVFYCATIQKIGFTAAAYQVWNGKSFNPPHWLPFSEAEIPIADIQLSPNGKQLFYTTFKDYPSKKAGFHFDLWQVERKGQSWSDPFPLKGALATSGNEFFPVLTNSGRLYYNSDYQGNSDLYYSELKGDEYSKPIALPSSINTELTEADAFIAADESLIIFVRVDAKDGYGKSDLYISFREPEGQWSEAQNLGPTINSDQIDGSPWLSPDKKILIFTSGRLDTNLKQEAFSNYQSFRNLNASHRNGSLNFYACKIDLQAYREKIKYEHI